jgi:hypothetical protein
MSAILPAAGPRIRWPRNGLCSVCPDSIIANGSAVPHTLVTTPSFAAAHHNAAHCLQSVEPFWRKFNDNARHAVAPQMPARRSRPWGPAAKCKRYSFAGPNLPGAGVAVVEIEGERILRVTPDGTTPDPRLLFISPGFVDPQINGFGGVHFSDSALTPEIVRSVVPMLWETGVTSFCPTLIINSQRDLLHSFRTLETGRREDVHIAISVPCYHLDGPYSAPGRAQGVHDPAFLRPPSWDGLDFRAPSASPGLDSRTVLCRHRTT